MSIFIADFVISCLVVLSSVRLESRQYDTEFDVLKNRNLGVPADQRLGINLARIRTVQRVYALVCSVEPIFYGGPQAVNIALGRLAGQRR